MGWWEGSEFHSVVAQVKDVSLDGAQLFVDNPPPEETPIWVRLQAGTMCDWVEASLVSISKQKQNPYRVRIKFEGGCPYAFFESATRGFTTNDNPAQRP